MSEHTYKMQVNILMAQVKQLELSLAGIREHRDSLEFEREKLIGALEKIRRDILEPDKITIHIERGLAEVKEQG